MTALFEFTTIRSLAAYLHNLNESAGQVGAGASNDKLDVDEFSNRKLRQAEAVRRASRRRAAPAP